MLLDSDKRVFFLVIVKTKDYNKIAKCRRLRPRIIIGINSIYHKTRVRKHSKQIIKQRGYLNIFIFL